MPVNPCFWESVTATAWAPAATATSQEEEGNYEHGFLQILTTLHFRFQDAEMGL